LGRAADVCRRTNPPARRVNIRGLDTEGVVLKHQGPRRRRAQLCGIALSAVVVLAAMVPASTAIADLATREATHDAKVEGVAIPRPYGGCDGPGGLADRPPGIGLRSRRAGLARPPGRRLAATDAPGRPLTNSYMPQLAAVGGLQSSRRRDVSRSPRAHPGRDPDSPTRRLGRLPG
jgi:hypothetical protein